ncbi:hypothetical protein LXL04_036085 [Taraxacum kok-saghyz]
MAHMSQLHFDILNVIMVMVATSSGGARDVARAAASCTMLLEQARSLDVLKVVNFQRLTFTIYDFVMHRHPNDLICMCAVAGNQAAQSILGKALLYHDLWFWRMVFEDNKQAYYGIINANEALHHHNLVRTFILKASSEDIVAMRSYLVDYVITYAGYNAAHEHCIIYTIYNMCSYEAAKLKVRRTGINYVYLTFGSFSSVLVRLQPPNEELYRENVVTLFDKLFPTAHS